MGLFRKRGEVLDLAEKYRKQQEQVSQMSAEIQDPKEESPMQNTGPVQTAFGFLGNLASSSNPISQSNDEENTSPSETPFEKRKKLTKRLLDMTTKLEDLSNQMYHLQQRIEVLEKKTDVNTF